MLFFLGTYLEVAFGAYGGVAAGGCVYFSVVEEADGTFLVGGEGANVGSSEAGC